MGWIVAIIVGAFIGWVDSLIMKTDAEQGPLANIIIGIVGATLGRWLFSDVLGLGGASAAGSFTLTGLFYGILGAVILIALLKAFNLMGSNRM